MKLSNASYALLNQIYDKNKKKIDKVNNNLMSIIEDPMMWASSYHRLKANEGSMTVGTDLETADEMSIDKFQESIDKIKGGTFEWSKARRVWIPKPGNKDKKRPLGIGNFRDRILQDIIRKILEVIYEPTFQKLEVNFGFRPKRSVADAMNKIHLERQGMTTAIEGDIVSAYDNVNHEKLIELLKRKISDKRFIKLIETG